MNKQNMIKIGNNLSEWSSYSCQPTTNDELRSDVKSTMELVNKSGSDDSKEKMLYQLQRLADLGDEYNSAEGIVITYKGRRLKLTGSFACVNAILGERFKFN